MNITEFDEMASCEKSHWWFIGRRAIMDSVLNKFINNKNNQILEIGCGTGGNLELLKNYGIVSAVEPDQHAISITMGNGFLSVQKGGLPDSLPKFDKKFDLICLFDVLEHVEDHLSGLKNCKKLLNPNGKVIITVPALKLLWSQHDEVHNHKRRYTNKEIISLVSQSGLKIVYCSYFNFFLFPTILLTRLVKALLNSKKGSDLKKQNSFFNVILKNIFSFEKYFIPRLILPIGVSIVVVAENVD